MTKKALALNRLFFFKSVNNSAFSRTAFLQSRQVVFLGGQSSLLCLFRRFVLPSSFALFVVPNTLLQNRLRRRERLQSATLITSFQAPFGDTSEAIPLNSLTTKASFELPVTRVTFVLILMLILMLFLMTIPTPTLHHNLIATSTGRVLRCQSLLIFETSKSACPIRITTITVRTTTTIITLITITQV